MTGLQSPIGKAGQRHACLTHYVDKRLKELAEFSYPKIVIAGDRDEAGSTLTIDIASTSKLLIPRQAAQSRVNYISKWRPQY